MIQQVLAFDFDGVILESVAVKDQAIFDLFEDTTMEERQRVLDLHRKNPGINRRDRIALLLNEGLGRTAPPDVVDRLLVRFSKLIWVGMMRCPEVLGVRNFLERLTIPCYVVSATPQEELREVSNQRNLSRYFTGVFGYPPQKTDLLRFIALRERVSPEMIFFIGDKLSDFKASQVVGTQFIGRRVLENETVFPKGIPLVDNFLTDTDSILLSIIQAKKHHG